MVSFPHFSEQTLKVNTRDDIYGYGLSILLIEYYIDEIELNDIRWCFEFVNTDKYCS